MLIDQFMPQWDASERHRITIQSTPERVYLALRTTDLGKHPIVAGLLALRALPGAIGNPRRLHELRARASRQVTLAAFEDQGFRVLAEEPPQELLLGLEGAFWKMRGGLKPVDLLTFTGPVPAGLARATWNFSIAPAGSASCVLSTETRVRTSDSVARRRFLLYWLLIRPASGLIRRLMLRAIRAEAEVT